MVSTHVVGITFRAMFPLCLAFKPECRESVRADRGYDISNCVKTLSVQDLEMYIELLAATMKHLLR